MNVNLEGKGELRLQVEVRLLISLPKDREMILDHLGGPNALKVERRHERTSGENVTTGWSQDATLLALKRKGPPVTEYGWSLEAGQNKGTYCLQEPPEGNEAFLIPGFRPNETHVGLLC